MNGTRFVTFVWACILLAPAASPALGAPKKEQAESPTRTISIAINGEPLATSSPPLAVRGRLLVPLREVFAGLGIGVTRSGQTITGRLPNGTVTVRVGSARVDVSGEPVLLDAPVSDIDGTTYMPLRLVTAALGATATYDQRGANVQIVSTFIGRNGGAELRRQGGGSDVQGVVSAIDVNSAPPSLTVVRGGTARTIAVTSSAKIWIEDVAIHAQQRSALEAIRVGDAVHAILASDGRVLSIFDFYKSTNGTVTAVGQSSVVLASGRVVTPGGATEVTLNGTTAKLADLKAGDYLTVRSNPESGELRQIVASRTLAAVAQGSPLPGASPTAADVTIASVSISAARPLRAGERFDVSMRGTPGGRATFDIGDYLTALPMNETQAGTYTGSFTIPGRFNVAQVPVYGRLTLGRGPGARAEASQTLSATTVPPTIGEIAPPQGQTVNNVRPSIYATFGTPSGIAISQSSIALVVNGHDVTSSSTRSGGFVTYTPGVDLPEGPVTVAVRVADAAGNAATKSWTFAIKTR